MLLVKCIKCDCPRGSERIGSGSYLCATNHWESVRNISVLVTAWECKSSSKCSTIFPLHFVIFFFIVYCIHG
jgi:hypothetical protein